MSNPDAPPTEPRRLPEDAESARLAGEPVGGGHTLGRQRLATSPERSAVEDFLRGMAREIEQRLEDLSPLVAEYGRLEAALRVLTSPPRRRRGRPETRVSQTVDLVRAQPGITIPEIAGRMGIKPNYLYRVLPQLADEGKVRRDGKGWHPASI